MINKYALLVKVAYRLNVNFIIQFAEYCYIKDRKIFDAQYYAQQRKDLSCGCNRLLIHFIRHGWKEGVSPCPFFSVQYYQTFNTDVLHNPLVHYLLYGDKEGRAPHPCFDTCFYKTNYKGALREDVTSLEHYLLHGAKLKYMPHYIFAIRDCSTNCFINASLKHIVCDENMRISLKKCLADRDYVAFDSLFNRNYAWDIRELGQVLIVDVGCSTENSSSYSSYSTVDKMNNTSLHYPVAHINRYDNVKIVGATKFVIKDKVLIHDELYEYTSEDYGVKAWQYYEKCKGQERCGVVIHVMYERRKAIKQGILISSDHDFNYFHWMVECLPMVEFVKIIKGFDEYPLLITADLHPNLKEALKRVIGEEREIIELKPGNMYDVEQLIVPTGLSRILDRYHGKIKLSDDVVLGPYWIRNVRKKLLGKFCNPSYRKLYLTRRSGTYRKLLNEKEIEIALLKEGFEIIDLAEVSFDFQVELFSQARIVVAPTGATITNMILMPPQSCFLALLSDHEIAEPQILDGCDVGLWAQLARICEVKYSQYNGIRAYARVDLHDDYYVDIDELLMITRKMERENIN